MRLIDANRFQETLNKACKEPDYQHEDEDWRTGLCLAGCLLDAEPTVDSFEDQNKSSIFPEEYDELLKDILGAYISARHFDIDIRTETLVDMYKYLKNLGYKKEANKQEKG